MLRRSLVSLRLFCCAVLFASGVQAEEAARFKFTTIDGGIELSDGDVKVYRYQRETKTAQGKFARANYVHPLYDFDGNELTEDGPPDHLHQRGIFWAWHQLLVDGKQICDPWVTTDTTWDVREAKTDVTENAAQLKLIVDWKSPNWLATDGSQRPLVREETTIVAHPLQPELRAIDFSIALLALEPELKIGGSNDDKGYGGFSPRLRLPKGVKFLAKEGEIAPQYGPMMAGAWVDVSAPFGSDAKQSGVAMLCHPSLPVFPPSWILRKAKSMQNPAYPGATASLLPTDKPLVLNYRLVVHRGAATTEQGENWQRDYAATAK